MSEGTVDGSQKCHHISFRSLFVHLHFGASVVSISFCAALSPIRALF